MSGDDGMDTDGSEGPELKKSSSLQRSAFLGMVLSGVLSLFIASIMFMIGVVHEFRLNARELRGLVQFFAVEIVEIYAETTEAAEMTLVHGEPLEMSAPRMVSAYTLGRANTLRVDPTLMATLRSIYGRHARVLRDLKTYKKGGKWHQMTAVVNECRTMDEEVRHVLKIAADEGVGDDALEPLESMLADAGSRIDTIVKTKEDLFPAVWVTKRISSIPVHVNGTAKRNFQVRNWSPDKPLAITRVTTSTECVALELPEGMTVEPLGELKISFEISPEGLEPGPFEETIIVETDCPGFEKSTISISGTVYPPKRSRGGAPSR